VKVDDACGAEGRDGLEDLADLGVVGLRGRSGQVARRAGAAGVGADDPGRELLELARVPRRGCRSALGHLDRRVGAVVRAADADELQGMAVDRAARPAVTRLVRVLRLRPGELHHCGDDAGEVLVVEGAECALPWRAVASSDGK
jgi:hypothetical protein